MSAFGGVCFYQAWRFAFDYQGELREKYYGRGGAYHQLFLQDHGHVGIIVGVIAGAICLLTALAMAWRFFTRFPAAILMPDRLWLHASFGRKPIPYSDICGVSLDRGKKGLIELNVLTEAPALRNWVFWTYFGSPYGVRIRDYSIDGSLYDLARFRNRLVERAQGARRRSGAG